MALIPGTRLGPYEVTAQIGVGGMGEVYGATDTNLKRAVALKVLPAAVSADAERLARFQREAEVLAALNHPNIAAIYGLERSTATTALVMELVEGPTLADRIAQGAIPVDDALPMATQLVEALEAAHERGIIHRDLKPANIKVRADGTVKVLDFGLAKAMEPTGAMSPGVSQPLTITSPAMMTGVGVILGTAAYMSPEQAKGRGADKRSDIWAFGCVLYEMLTGTRVFEGEDITETIASIVRANPDWSALPADTPPSIRRLLRRCLEKDRRQRLPDIGVARLDITEALANVDSPASPDATVASTRTRRRAEMFAWAVASVTTIAAVTFGTMTYLGRAPIDTRLYRTSILTSSNLTGDPAGRLAISPDGRRLAFLARGASDRTMLWVRPLDGLSAQPLPGTEDATHPFWSPDSRFLGFTAAGKLKKIDASSGLVMTLCDSASIGPGAWNRDDVILFAPAVRAAIHRVSAAGGTPSPVTLLDAEAGETGHRYPFFLPDGRHFLFLAVGGTVPRVLYVGALDGPDRTRLLEGSSNAAYAQGFLLFLREGTLLAQPFDATRLTVAGDASPVAEGVQMQPAGAGTFSVAETGALVYQTPEVGRRLRWLDREGKPVRTFGEQRSLYNSVAFSPDGTRAALTVNSTTGQGADIWIFDVARGIPMQLTSDPAVDESPIWSPDGSRIVFSSNRNGINGLYQRASSGEGTDVGLQVKFGTPTSWSADGRFIVYSTGFVGGRDVWVLPLEANDKPFKLLDTRLDEWQAQFSPDGRWIAFTSNEFGGSEVYAMPFPGPGGRTRISTSGGSFPRWRRDGKELFFETGGSLMAAAVSTDRGAFDVGPVRTLFPVRPAGAGRRSWDVAPDGQHFLVLENLDTEIVPITLVINWVSALRN